MNTAIKITKQLENPTSKYPEVVLIADEKAQIQLREMLADDHFTDVEREMAKHIFEGFTYHESASELGHLSEMPLIVKGDLVLGYHEHQIYSWVEQLADFGEVHFNVEGDFPIELTDLFSMTKETLVSLIKECQNDIPLVLIKKFAETLEVGQYDFSPDCKNYKAKMNQLFEMLQEFLAYDTDTDLYTSVGMFNE